MASILDVAREANVAPSTVSLVARGHPRVTDETRRRVQLVIDRLQYQPRSSKKTKAPRQHIAVLYSRSMVLSGELVDYCRKWIGGIRESFGDTGTDVSVHVCDPELDDDLMFSRALEKGDYDGLVTMGVRPNSDYFRELLAAKVPLVVMNQPPKRHEFSCVRADAYAGGRLAAAHLVKLGHRRVASLFSGTEQAPSVDLHQGFMEVMGEHGLEPVEDLPVGSVVFDEPETFRPLAQRLKASGATACFCGDPMGIRLVTALAALGVDVPQDFSVLGWDDLGFVAETERRLSSIGYDKREMGRLAGQMLQTLISKDGSVVNMSATVAIWLNEGDTVAAIPDAVDSVR